MKQKRGAIQLSITTIIVVVIGITLLVLGLAWVRSIFSQLGSLSDDTFKKAQSMIGELENVNSLLTLIPSQTSLPQKGDDAVKVVIANLEESSITVTITAATTDENIECGFLEGKKIVHTKGPYALNSGEQIQQPVIIKDKSSSIGLTSCEIRVTGDRETSQTLIIKIEKKSGLLS
jgi:hypothetical protein